MFEKRGSWCCSRSCPSKNINFKAVIIEPFRFEANLRFKNYSLVLKIPKQQKQILPIGNERTNEQSVQLELQAATVTS